MGHPRWPGFDSKTGNPPHDNAARNMNQRMYRDTKASLRFRGVVGRKRKKLLKRVEGGNYIKLVAAVMNDIADERQAA